MTAPTYAQRRTTGLTFADALARTRAALSKEGFGVPCAIDVQATMQAKLGISREPYVILGACNAPLAPRTLTTEPELGVLRPCNVAVYVIRGVTNVSAVAAEEMLGMVGNPELTPIAGEVADRLARVLGRVAGPVAG